MRVVVGGQLRILNDALRRYALLSRGPAEDASVYSAAAMFGSADNYARWCSAIQGLQSNNPLQLVKGILTTKLENHSSMEFLADAHWAEAEVRKQVRALLSQYQNSDLELRF